MKDPRLNKLAKLLLSHSLQLGDKEKVIISAVPSSKPLVKEIMKEAYALGVIPFIIWQEEETNRIMLEHAPDEQFRLQDKWFLELFKNADAFLAIQGEENDAEFGSVPSDQFVKHGKLMKTSDDYLYENLKWVLFEYPTPGAAQKAKMNFDQFYDYVLDVSTVDYDAMHQAQQPLKDLMERTDRVRIVGPGTDITFSINDIPAVICAGTHNVPDGEVYTAPVKDSVNGTITYNTPSPYQGVVHQNVSLTFKEGKIVEAISDHADKLNEVLDTDEGARYIGEFALGLNPVIKEPMGNILFDEKISGSLHFTPGDSYDETENGNSSSVHWDMVLIQRSEYGGGEVYFDDVLIRKDGLFVLEELKGLNP
ncbi:aminopeptidase [Terribacillus saccharophilus]|uniref:Aminopeptidase n=1 Tax=Terribacillus saccharophilus TaxID=361277 RepID=A0A268AAX5_9BACI|nr:aminopeptidase [Terribacillus saccharophilus]PAD21284.1 aminopeptidase [Terribacillus saccharophilus]PAF21138.1 aminopeptidase [Terribacillus saccharophilus]PAF39806.1 aminopeptidase [Terribacillus saccharophilus]